MYKQYVSVQEAVEEIIRQAPEPNTEIIPLDQAVGRILAQPIVADCSVPSFHKSPLDGFAVRFVDVQNASKDKPIVLKVIESIPAGHVPESEINEGEAARIMTGAPLPKGADTIIKFEDTMVQQDSNHHYLSGELVHILCSPKQAGNYSEIGEDMNEGDTIMGAGRLIDSAVVAVLATFGYHHVAVHTKPSVVVFASGDELVNVDEKPTYGKIRNSNSPSIASQILQWGAQVHVGNIVQDKTELVAATLLHALDRYQVVITTGGVSVGDYDVMKEVFQAIGAEILFWRVAMRPGTPMVVAKWKDCMIFGLSGNPSASYISCELFVRAYILKLQGRNDVWRNPVKGILSEPVGKVVNQDRFLRAVSYIDQQGRHLVKPLPKQKSGILGNLIDANSLIYVPYNAQTIHVGDMVDVILLQAPKEVSV